MTTRLAIISSHPIQYNAPAFRALAEMPGFAVKVFYEWEGPANWDMEFGRSVVWDIPLLDGYEYQFVANRSSSPGTHHFRGIDNPSLINEIKAWNPDVVLLYGWAFASHVRVLRYFRGRVPILFRGDSTLLDERRGLKVMARRALLRVVYSHIDVALHTGANNRAYFRAHGVRRDQLQWAPHAVDVDRFAATEDTEQSARKWRNDLGIGDDDVVFLYAGKLSPRKGVSELVNAFCELPQATSSRKAHLVLVGDGELAEGLKLSTRSRSDVHFPGFQNQSVMPVVYAMGDVLVLPSKWGETWGLAVNEAMASGRAAILSDKVGCAADLVEQRDTGIIFRHDEPDSLKRALLRVVTDRAVAPAMGTRALAEIQNWSIAVYAEKVRLACESLGGSGTKGRMIATI